MKTTLLALATTVGLGIAGASVANAATISPGAILKELDNAPTSAQHVRWRYHRHWYWVCRSTVTGRILYYGRC